MIFWSHVIFDSILENFSTTDHFRFVTTMTRRLYLAMTDRLRLLSNRTSFWARRKPKRSAANFWLWFPTTRPENKSLLHWWVRYLRASVSQFIPKSMKFLKFDRSRSLINMEKRSHWAICCSWQSLLAKKENAPLTQPPNHVRYTVFSENRFRRVYGIRKINRPSYLNFFHTLIVP